MEGVKGGIAMAWCPNCKCEYIEGIKVCADCGCKLVDTLETESQIEDTIEENVAETENFEFDEEEPAPKYHSLYMNNEERAEENRTAAYTLLLVGGAGLVLIVLFFFDVINLHMALTSKYMITGVMGALFILFIIMGIVSMKNSKILTQKASKENNLTMEIKKWCKENLKREQVDVQLELGEQPEELKYFQRFDYMKKAIQNQFMNLDEAYLERLIEEVYPEIFEVEEV